MNGHVSRVSLLALVTAALFVPGLARAQCPPDPDARLNEVSETATFKFDSGNQLRTRQATATLVGKTREGTPICPQTDPPIAVNGYCTMSVTASDLIRGDTGQGSVSGDFYVLGPGDNPHDGDERILIQGTLRGKIDLAPALLFQTPLGYLIDASLHGRGAKGGPLAGEVFKADFKGIFRLPAPRAAFESFGVFCAGEFCYDCGLGEPQTLTSRDMSLDTPTVLLEITFD